MVSSNSTPKFSRTILVRYERHLRICKRRGEKKMTIACFARQYRILASKAQKQYHSTHKLANKYFCWRTADSRRANVSLKAFIDFHRKADKDITGRIKRTKRNYGLIARLIG